MNLISPWVMGMGYVEMLRVFANINLMREKGRERLESKPNKSFTPFQFSRPSALPFTMTKQHANWSPYDNNGGSWVTIARVDYCVIAADMRMSTGYNILTRDYSKISQLSEGEDNSSKRKGTKVLVKVIYLLLVV